LGHPVDVDSAVDDGDNDHMTSMQTWREVNPDSLEQSCCMPKILRSVGVLVGVKLNLNHVIQ